MIEKPLVSVLMTSYNREKYIAQAIESVLNSTYSNLELIIVDDKSIDKTVGIANRYATVDSRVKVYNNEKNLGDYPNRNKAAFYAKGKYIKYVDADDMINADCLEVMVGMIEKYPEAGYGICPAEQDIQRQFPYALNPSEAYLYHYIKHIGVFNRSPLCAIINKKAFDHVGGFTGKRMVGDSEMWHKLSLEFSVVIMPQGLVWYRYHDEQEQNHTNLFLLDYLTVAEENVLKSSLEQSEKQIILNKLRRNMFLRLLRNPMNMSLTERWRFYKQSSIEVSKLLHDTKVLSVDKQLRK